jgi:eukaryotic-like serine/threonine-protein kinase
MSERTGGMIEDIITLEDGGEMSERAGSMIEDIITLEDGGEMSYRRGSVIADRFELEDRWGMFGMASVFRARDRETGAPVLVKVMHAFALDKGVQELLHREATTLAGFCHPRIPRFVAYGTTPEEGPYLVMEALEGVCLDGHLEAGVRGIDESLVIARGVAEALAAMHAGGTVHGDVKPVHICLVGADPHSVKLFGFELARKFEETAAERTADTEWMPLAGTPLYMAPEQLTLEVRIGPPADIFALGSVLFECLTGRPPFLGQSIFDLFWGKRTREAPRLGEVRPGIPPALGDLVARMLARDPTARPRNGTALLEELDRLATGPLE